MNFLSFLRESLLLEGGAAIKGAVPVDQEEIKQLLPDLLSFITSKLQVDNESVALIGSAGKKPESTDTSGDIDLVVKINTSDLIDRLDELKETNPVHKMPTINVYSIGYKWSNKLIQVDLIPVDDLEYASWAYHADEEDLKLGLKGAHRNELLFAMIKHTNLNKIKNADGEVIEQDRLFLDLSRGILRGKQSREGKNKLLSSFKTVGEKELIADDLRAVLNILFDKTMTAKDTLTFYQVYDIINSKAYKNYDNRMTIIDMAMTGIKKKGLKIPKI